MLFESTQILSELRQVLKTPDIDKQLSSFLESLPNIREGILKKVILKIIFKMLQNAFTLS